MAAAPAPAQPKGATAVLVLADGSVIWGQGFGAEGAAVGEVCFNTSMTGYQEVLTDPSYAGQILISTYPLIGNYGTSPGWCESRKMHVEGYVVREICREARHSESKASLQQRMEAEGVPGIWGIDTRAVVRHVRNFGVMPAAICTYEGKLEVEPLLEKARALDYSKINFVENP